MFTKAIQPSARSLPQTRVTLLMGFAVFMTTGAAYAQEISITNVPEENTPPFYARVGLGIELAEPGEQVFHDDQWAAIPFYRDPDSVPKDFNLLDFFDFNVEGVTEGFLLEGFEIRTAPGPPIHTTSVSNGTDLVPVWFAPWPELERAFAGGLTIGELESTQSLRKGNANFFTEVLNPAESALVGMIAINADGFLEDGTTAFEFHAFDDTHRGPHVQIGFQAIPEPSSLFLSLTGLGALLSRLRTLRERCLTPPILPASQESLTS